MARLSLALPKKARPSGGPSNGFSSEPDFFHAENTQSALEPFGRADSSSASSVVTGIPDTIAVGTIGDFVNQDVNGILSGDRWAITNVTYSFPSSSTFYGTSVTYPDPAPFNGFQVLSATQQAAARYAFSLISAYTNLTFSEITDTSTSQALIRLAGSSSPSTSYAYYPYGGNAGGDIFLGNVRNDAAAKGSYGFYSILHEIGHAVGLKHGQDDDLVHGVLPADHDSNSWSVMDYHSFIGGDSNYRNSDGNGNQTYMSDDIGALQYLYGANFNTNAGNTIYSWSLTTGEEYINGVGQGASSTNTIYEAIWDGNGTDVYDLSNYTSNISVDLDPGAWSTFSSNQLANLDSSNVGLHLAPGNIVNADEYNGDPRSLIEGAYGGSGNDTIVGNYADNLLRGGPGNDNLDGGSGFDTALFSGSQNQYTLTLNASGSYTITGPDGVDQLSNIESLQFDGATSVAIQSLMTQPGFTILDTTTNVSAAVAGNPYVGPVSGLQHQYVAITSDNLNITSLVPNVFIHSGSGMDGLNVSQSNGNNILDGYTGSNFLTGGSGNDTFYMDDRDPASPIFSTIANFHAGDDATVWGVNATDFAMLRLDNQGAAGFTGLDLIFTAPGHLDTSFVLAGYSGADLTNGRLTLSYGRTQDLPNLPGSQYLTVHANS